jgi:hypothetical protein
VRQLICRPRNRLSKSRPLGTKPCKLWKLEHSSS